MVRVERATGRAPARLLAMALTGLALLAGCSAGPGVPAAAAEAPGTTAPPPTADAPNTISTATSAAPTTTSATTTTTSVPTTTTTLAPAPTTTTTTVPPVGWVALTFDDGPVPGTYAILDILDAYGVKATFFALGSRVTAYPEIAREIVARGHSLQSHGYSHGKWTGMSDAGVRRDIERANQAIVAVTGVAPTCVRPPWGLTSGRTGGVAASLGMKVTLWDEDPSDYLHRDGLRLLAASAEWRPDSIVIGHDTHHAVWAPVLAEIIEGLQGRGLALVPLCNYLPTAPRPLEPE